MAIPYNQLICNITQNYLATIDLDNPPEPYEIEEELLNKERDDITIVNALLAKGEKYKIPKELNPAQIAEIMATLHSIKCIACAGLGIDAEYDLLAIYQTSGPNEGIYVKDESIFNNIARSYNYSISDGALKQVMNRLKEIAPRVERCKDKNLIAVNNGIFDYENKVLEPFSPDYVFTTKSHVNYNPVAKNVIIHNDDDNTDWDIESWMGELNDDPAVVNLLWEILGAVIRPLVRWNKSAWFYSEKGNNGKGTLCELMRSLCGYGAYASIPISDFNKDFALEPLIRASAIIVDENDVGTYIDKAANLKAIITNDVVSINRKFKEPISFQFRGFMTQCMNEYPRVKDKTDSFIRRQLFVPFDKCFTGRERKYIKEDYLHRPEVLEYVLYKVLHDTNYYTLSEPAACKMVLEEFKTFNNPVKEFFEEISPRFQWDLIPIAMLYDLFKAWFRKNTPSGTIMGRNVFIKEIKKVVENSDEWEYTGKSPVRSSGKNMDKPELLIYDYNLVDWKNQSYAGNNINLVCTIVQQPMYRGLVRKNTSQSNSNSLNDSTNDSTDDSNDDSNNSNVA